MLCGNYILSNRSEWTFYFLSSVQFNFTIGEKKISDFLNKLDIKIRITNKKITIFSQLKRSLLNNMFI